MDIAPFIFQSFEFPKVLSPSASAFKKVLKGTSMDLAPFYSQHAKSQIINIRWWWANILMKSMLNDEYWPSEIFFGKKSKLPKMDLAPFYSHAKFLEKIKVDATCTHLFWTHSRKPDIYRDLSLAVNRPPNWEPGKWESEFTASLTVCSCAHHRHMLVEQKLYYIAINEQLMTYSDCVTLNRLCSWH